MAPRLIAIGAFLAALTSTARAEPPGSRVRSPTADAVFLPNGLALPYPTLRVFRAFGRCRSAGKRPERWKGAWKSHEHEGIDLGGLGPDGGLGSAVRSLARARIVEIAHGDDLPPKFGVTDRRPGVLTRDGEIYPRSFELRGYGEVHFFTRARGWYRTGNMVVTEGVADGGRLAGHRIRYMHLGAARPDLKVGDVLEAGEELGVLGGTAVQDAAPHVHIDIRDPDGESVDVAPLIGLVTSAWCGVPRQRALSERRAFQEAAAQVPGWRPDTWAPPVGAGPIGESGRALPTVDLTRTPEPLVASGLVPARSRFWHELLLPSPCSPYVVDEDFASRAYAGHAWRLRVLRGQSFDLSIVTPPLRARAQSSANPRFAIIDETAQRVSHPAAPDDSFAGPPTLVVDVPNENAPERVRFGAEVTGEVLIVVLAQAEPYRITLTERCKHAR